MGGYVEDVMALLYLAAVFVGIIMVGGLIAFVALLMKN